MSLIRCAAEQNTVQARGFPYRQDIAKHTADLGIISKSVSVSDCILLGVQSEISALSRIQGIASHSCKCRAYRVHTTLAFWSKCPIRDSGRLQNPDGGSPLNHCTIPTTQPTISQCWYPEKKISLCSSCHIHTNFTLRWPVYSTDSRRH